MLVQYCSLFYLKYASGTWPNASRCRAERGEEVQARLYIFIFVGAFVRISHSISNASFVFSILEVEQTHQYVWF